MKTIDSRPRVCDRPFERPFSIAEATGHVQAWLEVPTRELLDEVSDGIVAEYTALRQIEKAVADGEFGAAGPLSAKERGGTVVTDGRAARNACAERSVVMTGSIGILKACSLDGTLVPQEADEVLQAMVAAGFYAPVSRISDLI